MLHIYLERSAVHVSYREEVVFGELAHLLDIHLGVVHLEGTHEEVEVHGFN